MMSDKQKYLQTIEENASLFTDVSDQIWDFAELSLMEFQSAKLYCEVLAKEGFTVETPIAGIETAFKASYGIPTAFIGTWGSGKPVIGILAEYDALTGLSQQAGAVERKEVVSGGCGHGCGHNMLGAGSLAAAFAIKKYLEDGHTGTVIFYGCPGEEGGAAKAFMARDRIWEELDAALTWHPDDVNQVTSGTCNTCIQTEYKFTGIASHASGSPEFGRSALDAVELMNVGVQFLREHMPQEARIHYAITDAGGNSPNVVQPHAQVLYMVRSQLAKDALALQERVDKIAQGAAMMTETTVKKRFIDGCSNTVPNKVLEQLLYKNFSEIGVPQHTEQEIAYAQQIIASYEMPNDHLPGNACDESEEIAAYVDKVSQHGTVPLNDFLVPYLFSTKQRAGSTDVGDVSWLVPTAQINTVTFPSKAPGHSWQNVSCGKTSIGHKGLLTAGKVLAATAIDLFEQPQLLEQAKEEFSKRTVGGYFCPVPEDAVPTVVGGQF